MQHHFFPHWLDQSLLFPSYANPDPQAGLLGRAPTSTTSMLSALSCSPEPAAVPADQDRHPRRGQGGDPQVAALGPGQSGVPAGCGRTSADWPLKGKVDGSAHILGDKGLVFLFNGTGTELPAAFPLDASIGLEGEGRFTVTQEYPASDRIQTAHARQTIRWEVPPRTAVALRIQPADK